MTIYEMTLHDEISRGDYLTIRRVPGGWIYTTFTNNDGDWYGSSTFVPYHNEFQSKEIP
jgi:hypothetical protein